MLADSFDRTLDYVSHSSSNAAIALAGLLGVLLLAWRLWRFTLRPYLHPDEPEELPYWIPLIGHLVPFIGDAQALFARARHHFGNTREVFSLTAAGKKFYIITRSKDVGEAYRNETTLSYKVFAQNLMRSCGVSAEGLDTLHKVSTEQKQKPLVARLRQMHVDQLSPGPRLDWLTHKFCETFSTELHAEYLENQNPFAVHTKPGSIDMPLSKWVADLFIRAGERAYYGDSLVNLDPELKWHFLKFDDLSYQISYDYPRSMAKEAFGSLDYMVRTLDTYFAQPLEKRSDMAWFAAGFEEESKKANISRHDLSVLHMFVYWSLNSNPHQAAFWLLSHLLTNPTLLSAIRTETAAVFNSTGTLIPSRLDDSCPLLTAATNEMLRFTANSVSAREITQDTLIGAKLLRKGNLLLIPHRQLHYDETVFGSPIDTFTSTRFLENPKLTRNNSWKPFGGGSSMCPGRFLVRRVVGAFVALLLRDFEVERVPGQEVPAQKRTPRLGLTRNCEGDEFWVRVTPKAGGQLSVNG